MLIEMGCYRHTCAAKWGNKKLARLLKIPTIVAIPERRKEANRVYRMMLMNSLHVRLGSNFASQLAKNKCVRISHKLTTIAAIHMGKQAQHLNLFGLPTEDGLVGSDGIRGSASIVCPESPLADIIDKGYVSACDSLGRCTGTTRFGLGSRCRIGKRESEEN